MSFLGMSWWRYASMLARSQQFRGENWKIYNEAMELIVKGVER